MKESVETRKLTLKTPAGICLIESLGLVIFAALTIYTGYEIISFKAFADGFDYIMLILFLACMILFIIFGIYLMLQRVSMIGSEIIYKVSLFQNRSISLSQIDHFDIRLSFSFFGDKAVFFSDQIPVFKVISLSDHYMDFLIEILSAGIPVTMGGKEPTEAEITSYLSSYRH